jgi:hypothetical protein
MAWASLWLRSPDQLIKTRIGAQPLADKMVDYRE